MQKKIIALAIAAAFAAPAVAMAEATVYGTLDGGLRSATAGGVTSNTMGSGTYNSNRWGIKASEDLGDGLKANVGLEGDIITGTGNGKAEAGTTNELFSRQSTVGLEGGFGKVDLGRQYSVAFKTIGTYDPFGFKYIAITQANAASISNRYDNDVSYTGKFGDVTVMAEHTIPATGDDSTSTTAAGVGYASGDINVGGAYSKTKVNGTLADTTYVTVGAGYKFGDGKVSIGYAKNDVAAATTNAVATYTFVGGSYNVSNKIGATVGYYKKVSNPANSSVETTLTTIVGGVTYALSKKTNMYVEADKSTSDTSGTSTDSNGWSLGLATAF